MADENNFPVNDEDPQEDQPTSPYNSLTDNRDSQETQPMDSYSRDDQPTSPFPQENQSASYSQETQSTAPYNSVTDTQQTSPYNPIPDTQPTSPYNPVSSGGYSSADAAVEQPKQKKGSAGRTFLLAFLGALVACIIVFGVAGATGFIGPNSTGSNSGTSENSTTLGATTNTTVVSGDENTALAEAVAAKALPSVVSIYVYTDASSSSTYGFSFGFDYGYDYGDSGALTQSSLGSGVVLTEDGYIVTNYHVIEGAEALKVTIEGEEYDAEVIGSDSSSDIAVVKAENASDLTPIEIGDSDNLTIGEWVMSIGCPFGLEQSVATGIVSATSRSQILDSSTTSGETTIYPNMIQTDAAINPGNSGGALVDSNGKLIGINTLITSYSGSYSGVGFAIPVNYAINLAQQIIDGKSPTHAQLGVSLTTIDSQVAQRYGFSVDAGAYVSAITADSGAEAAGIEVGDIIIAFDGTSVESATDLMLDVRTHNPGDVVLVTVNRNGEVIDFEVTLGSDESTAVEAESESESESNDEGGSSIFDLFRDYGGNNGYDYNYNYNW